MPKHRKAPALIRSKAQILEAASRNQIAFSDTHCGCRVAICPPEGIKLDDGGVYMPSGLQLKIWAIWEEFWNVWVPEATRGEPFICVHNGDAIDGSHHGSTTQISQNIEDQVDLAYNILKPVVEKCEGRYYHIRGTEAHVGQSAVNEERLAKRLDAIPNEHGQYARYELFKKCGDKLVHYMHHVGTTGSSAYESTAVWKEMVEAYVEAGRFGDVPPDVLVRSHRHRNIEIRAGAAKGYCMSLVTAAWQLKTPFTYKIPGGRQSQPQIGGSIIRISAEDELHARHFVKRMERPRAE